MRTNLRIACAAFVSLAAASCAAGQITAGPRLGAVNRGLGRPDVGIGVAATAAIEVPPKIGLYADAIGTGFVAGAPGVILDAHATVTSGVSSPSVEIGGGVGASLLSVHLCGPEWCGRQTGVVPSADVRVKYTLSRSRRGRTFGVVGEGVAHWVPRSAVLPGLNGRATLGAEWGF